MKKEEINLTRYYSIRETTKLIPWLNSEPTLQKMIHNDVKNNKNQLFKAIILKRSKQRRYYIKGEHIQSIIDRFNSGELEQSFLKLLTKA